MVRSNLAILLAERNLRITKVSNDTGISRTTLTNLANNYGVGIQMDTLNTLCMYLKVTPNQLLSFVPVNVEVNDVTYHGDNSIDISLQISDQTGKYTCSLSGEGKPIFEDSETISGIEISVRLWDEEVNGPDLPLKNQIIIQSFAKLSVSFLTDIEGKITDEVIESIEQFYSSRLSASDLAEGHGLEISNSIDVDFRWCDELQPKVRE